MATKHTKSIFCPIAQKGAERLKSTYVQMCPSLAGTSGTFLQLACCGHWSHPPKGSQISTHWLGVLEPALEIRHLGVALARSGTSSGHVPSKIPKQRRGVFLDFVILVSPPMHVPGIVATGQVHIVDFCPIAQKGAER